MKAEELAKGSRPLRVLQTVVADIGDQPPASWDVWKLAELMQRRNQGTLSSRDAATLNSLQADLQAYEEACSASDRPLACGLDSQLRAARRCLEWRAEIEAGDGGAIIDAASLCAAHGLIQPGWLASRFVIRVDVVRRGLVKSWTESGSFGPAHSAGTNRAGEQANRHDAPEMYWAALELLSEQPTRPIDRGFWEEVGGRFDYRSASRVEGLVRGYIKAANCAPLADLKGLMVKGVSLDEALRQVDEEKAYAAFIGDGGTRDEWIAIFGECAREDEMQSLGASATRKVN